MSDYPFITNDELDEDIEVFCNIACCKAEARWAMNHYIVLMREGMDAETAFKQVIEALRVGDDND